MIGAELAGDMMAGAKLAGNVSVFLRGNSYRPILLCAASIRLRKTTHNKTKIGHSIGNRKILKKKHSKILFKI